MKSGDKAELFINSLGKQGEGIAFYNGMNVFVDAALPQEKVLARLKIIKSSYAKAQLISIKQPHEQRIVPACTRYEDCGGCQVMHLSYEGQREIKTNLVKKALNGINGFDSINVLSCIASPKPFHYRNKIQLPVANVDDEIVSGFYKRGSHEIIPYEHCIVHHDSMEKTAQYIRHFLKTSLVKPYSEETQNGTLRHFIIRANEKGEQLVGFVTTGKQKTAVKDLALQIYSGLENVVGVIENINQKKQNTILGHENILLFGHSCLREEIDGLAFNISLPSFFQVNLSAAKILYKTALDFAKLTKNSVVLDAYCGIGTMSLLAAKRSKKVIGAECIEAAVLDAKENARINEITNATFICSKIEENVKIFKNIDVALVNPPRQGLNEKVVNAINEYGPKKMVYVSCNPQSLARDAKMLTEYKLIKVQPVDMFPQTMHVESVALLLRNS